MADIKWIKIVTDVFDDEKMYAIECMPDGRDIELIWFKLLCLAGKCNQNGFLMINKKIAYTDEMLSKIFRMDLGVVQRALDIFQSLEMIEVVENAYMISNWTLYQSNDRLEEIKEKNRQKQQRYRDKQKALAIEDKEERYVTNNVTRDVTNNVIPSYSYSISKSNISNFNSLLNTNEYIYINNNEELKDVIESWLSYKDSKGKQKLHYAESSLKGLINKFIDMDMRYGTTAVRYAVDETILNGWQGIVWEKAETKTTTNNKHRDIRQELENL